MERREKPKVGDKIVTWFSDQPDRLSRILSVSPYRGQYPQFFKWDLEVTAPRTKRGSLVICVSEDWRND